ncbi:MAG TPA: adenylate/guanylate cyclase domain-containing protein [Gaiellaceae bacterium]|nr:adenylate/guanylate cyclase domain-containing protein [Gaiellaceae bacterium]
MSQVLDSPLDQARAAAGRQAWRAAYAAFGDVDVTELSAADLENYGEAAWWSGQIDEALRHREKAFAAYTSDGDGRGAARMAMTLAWDYEGKGAFAVAGGWLATAERLLADLDEVPEHGRLILVHALAALFAEGDFERAIELFDEAYELAKRVGDRDAQMLAISGKGRAFIKKGQIDKGLGLLDEASASALCGDISAHSAGLVYCITISSCQDVGDYRRAAEWTEAANRWCDTLDVTGFPGACRVHRAEAMRLRGDWSAAEVQALAACEELKDFDQTIPAAGYYEVGEIRRRRGDLAGAEEAYRISSDLGREPQPGLSLVRLAEGKVDAAVAGIRRSLDEAREPLFRLRRLPAQVEIALAARDLKTARAAADEAEQIVDSYKIGERRAAAFDATVHFARGQILLAENDPDSAIAALKHARDAWQGVGAPYETARARAALGAAYRRAGDEHGSTVELESALAAFERLGAAPEAARINELLGRVATRRTFLFTDIVDSTRLLDTLGDEKWRRLLARHDELIREAIAESGGEVVKQTGDGFFASFESAKAAVEAAVAIQRALAGEIVAPDVRIGAHSAGAFRTDAESSDYGGQGVHVAARIGAAATAGEILVSAETLDGIGASFRVSEARTATLKGVEQPVEVVSVDWR